MRVVLDTNVFISGIFWEGNFSSRIIDLWRNQKLNLVSSLPLIEELVKTLKTFKIQMPEEMIEDWEKRIIENAIIVEPTEKVGVVTEDPDDNKFLETAIAGDAKVIISQDKHLLKLKEYNGIKIIKPEDFLKMLEKNAKKEF